MFALTALVVIVGGMFLIMHLSDAKNTWEAPPPQTHDADSVMVFLFSSQSDTVWSIYIPAKGIPPLDTLGITWWTGGVQQSMVYTGWNEIDRYFEEPDRNIHGVPQDDKPGL